MGTKKISELPASTSLSNDSLFPVVTSGETKKATYELLKESLREDLIDDVDTFFVNGADYGEVGRWWDNNPNGEDRLYRFVTLTGNGRTIKFADNDDQITGVTTDRAGFVGNARDYTESDVTRNIVGIVGIVPVRTNDNSITANDRVMSDAHGYAIKSTNNLGYRVLSVLERGLLEIVVSPNTDLIQRIKTDISNLQMNDVIVDTVSVAGLTYTTGAADDLYIAQFMGLLKDFYNNRKKADGSNVFVYGHNTPVDGAETNEIDCSAFVWYALSGLSFADAYPHLASKDTSDWADDSGNDNVSSDTANDTDSNGTTPLTLSAGDYPWVIDFNDYKRKKVNNEYPIRTASQMCELFEDSGWSVEFADDFSNLKRGDIIFYAKKNDDGMWKQPNRYKHVSHVAVVSSTYENDGTYGIDAKYPFKHTLFEVSTYGTVVLNTTLEKRTPEYVVAVCRPDFGAMNELSKVGGAYNINGSYDVSKCFESGTYYLTSNNKVGLPAGIESGLGYSLTVDCTYNKWGKIYSVIQTLYNTKGTGVYARKQYCYPSYVPSSSKWTEWESLTGGATGTGGGLTETEVNALIDAKVTAHVTDDHINSLIDAKLTPLEALADSILEVM